MTYAPNDRNFYDADSHVMELPNFIIDYADKEFKDLIPPVNYKASLVTDEEVEEIVNNGGKHSTQHVEAQIALGDRLIAESKEIQALGAFDRDDRRKVKQRPRSYSTRTAKEGEAGTANRNGKSSFTTLR